MFGGHSPFYHERRSGEVLNAETACLPGEAIRPGRASFKEAGSLKPGARQMGGQERGKHEDKAGQGHKDADKST